MQIPDHLIDRWRRVPLDRRKTLYQAMLLVVTGPGMHPKDRESCAAAMDILVFIADGGVIPRGTR